MRSKITHGSDATISDRLADVGDSLEELYLHVGDVVRDSAEDMRGRWNDARIGLESKRAMLVGRAERLRNAGRDASVELRDGFESAYSELKEAIRDARDKFS